MKKLNILFEDKSLLVVYKEGGLSTVKNDKYNDNLYSLVYDYLHKKNQKVFVVHRLDKDTSGLVLFAKNENVKDNLQKNWENTTRKYYAIVHGKTKDNGIIESYLKETKTLLTYSTSDKCGVYAKTLYEKVSFNKLYTLLNIDIKTGRKNQIRVHMKDNMTPILGDKKYGKKDGYRKMMLNAYYLAFMHPITHKEIVIDTGIPKEFTKCMENVK